MPLVLRRLGDLESGYTRLDSAEGSVAQTKCFSSATSESVREVRPNQLSNQIIIVLVQPSCLSVYRRSLTDGLKSRLRSEVACHYPIDLLPSFFDMDLIGNGYLPQLYRE